MKAVTLSAAAVILSGAKDLLVAQVPQRPDTAPVTAINAARTPLPPEAASAGVTKFSFIAHGDARQWNASFVGLINRITTDGGIPYFLAPGNHDVTGSDHLADQHLVRPGMTPGEQAYHYLVIHVDGARMWLQGIGVDWGSGFAPYRGSRATLADSTAY